MATQLVANPQVFALWIRLQQLGVVGGSVAPAVGRLGTRYLAQRQVKLQPRAIAGSVPAQPQRDRVPDAPLRPLHLPVEPDPSASAAIRSRPVGMHAQPQPLFAHRH